MGETYFLLSLLFLFLHRDYKQGHQQRDIWLYDEAEWRDPGPHLDPSQKPPLPGHGESSVLVYCLFISVRFQKTKLSH